MIDSFLILLLGLYDPLLWETYDGIFTDDEKEDGVDI